MKLLNLKYIYKVLPAFLQDIMLTTYGYKLKRERYGKTYHKYFNIYKNKLNTDKQSSKKEQLELLKEFLNFTYNSSSYYKKLYDENNVDLSIIKSIKDLESLPVIEKEMIRTNSDAFHTIDRDKSILTTTGGTTGKSLEVRFTKADFQKRMAYLDAFKYKVGISDPMNASKATFSGRPVVHSNTTKTFWRNNWAYKQRLYSTYHLNETTIPLYLNNLNSYKPNIINGFVSSIHELAEFILRNKTALTFRPQAIFTTSETLLPHQKECIEKAFNTSVFDQYASGEGAPFITECTARNLHYRIETGVIEVNEHNEMIVTSFTTHGTPLVRYNISDLVYFKEGTCSCGTSDPLVDRIEGRRVDYLLAPDGRKISLSLLSIVTKDTPQSIIKLQFIQKTVKNLKVLVVKDDRLFQPEHEMFMLKQIQYQFGDTINVQFEYVDDIPKENSGKFRLIKNEIEN